MPVNISEQDRERALHPRGQWLQSEKPSATATSVVPNHDLGAGYPFDRAMRCGRIRDWGSFVRSRLLSLAGQPGLCGHVPFPHRFCWRRRSHPFDLDLMWACLPLYFWPGALGLVGLGQPCERDVSVGMILHFCLGLRRAFLDPSTPPIYSRHEHLFGSIVAGRLCPGLAIGGVALAVMMLLRLSYGHCYS